ncbi:agarase [Thalassotalea litorea]|uniref:Agarase n=1 Tax=Thalassotalea litorea TaxID=2020715 RepID=A0A5R9IWU0_9GAMM|nr:agarase [Thalassotalea litorea]TLU66388.1 agarase [Thalassotalea litorea]
MSNHSTLQMLFTTGVLTTSLWLVGCHQPSSPDILSETKENHSNLLLSFDDEAPLHQVNVHNANKSLLASEHGQAVKIDFASASNHESVVEFVPDELWDWSNQGNFGIAMDIENPELSSVHLYVSVKDSHGVAHNRSVAIPAQSSQRYLIELSGPDLEIETGIRSNPFSWQDNYQPIIWRYGNKHIDLSKVASLGFKVTGVAENKTLIFDDITLVQPNAMDENYLIGLVDKFGQNAKQEFTNEVHSDEQLVAIAEQEQSSLVSNDIADRSKFNGWKLGPKLQASGYYRVEKYQGKWSLVDPEGYLFFSNGIANVRMANTSTITGYDFDATYIKQRQSGDLTPEDSIGLNRAPKDAWPSRYETSKMRSQMFTWLPEYESPMGQHFGYRREVHTGAIDKGETYSFYQANLTRKYQTNDIQLAEQKWRDTTIKRMQSWGFTSFGNWIDPSFYSMQQYPYFANGWIIGDFKTVSSGNDYWAPLPDPFDPVFKERAMITVQQVADEVNDSPWCVGVFIDNEKSWGQMGKYESQFAVPINALRLDRKSSPTKAHFSALMQQKYSTIEAFNQAWEIDLESWDSFASGFELREFNESVVADLSTMLYEFGLQYFTVVNQAMETFMPNHLYMGVRFADWGMTPELRKAASEVADVVSYNYYKEVINDEFWRFLDEIDKPAIIGEFHNGALDSGLLNPGLIHAASQQDRGKKYAEYVNSAIDNPYFVGTHWFQYIDSPLTGRALDGENYNVGFVSVTDIPYAPLVDAARQVNRNLYQRRYGHNEP